MSRIDGIEEVGHQIESSPASELAAHHPVDLSHPVILSKIQSASPVAENLHKESQKIVAARQYRR